MKNEKAMSVISTLGGDCLDLYISLDLKVCVCVRKRKRQKQTNKQTHTERRRHRETHRERTHLEGVSQSKILS